MAYNFRTDFGANVGDRGSVMRAWSAAMARIKTEGGGVLDVTGGYFETEIPAGAVCLDIASGGAPVDNLTLNIAPDATLAQPTGLPDRQISLLRANRCKGLKIVGGGTLDGAWDNAIGKVDDHTGINHATQGDPKNQGLALRGTLGAVVDGIKIRRMYGDGIWHGHEVADNDPNTLEAHATDTVLRNIDCDMTGRHGLTFAGPSDRVSVIDCRWTNPYGRAIGFEGARSTYVDFIGGYAGNWWGQKGVNNAVVIDGVDGKPCERITFGGGFLCDGVFLVERALEIDVRGIAIRTTWGGKSWAPVYVTMNARRVRFYDNDIVDYNLPIQLTTTSDNKNTHAAACQVGFYASSTGWTAPMDIEFVGNRIRAMGVHGFRACGASATFIENEIELLPNAAGVRGRGIDLFSEKPGMRIVARGNKSYNAGGQHLRARFSGSSVNAMALLDVSGERAYDNQPTPTCIDTVVIDPAKHVLDLRVADIKPVNELGAGSGVIGAGGVIGNPP